MFDFLCHTVLLRLAKAPVSYAGGLKTDETGMHAFIFLRRSGKLYFSLFIFTMILPAGLSERVKMLLLLLPICPDIPPGYSITAHGRGAALESHRDDIILLLKRNAADDELCQDMLVKDLLESCELYLAFRLLVSKQSVGSHTRVSTSISCYGGCSPNLCKSFEGCQARQENKGSPRTQKQTAS